MLYQAPTTAVVFLLYVCSENKFPGDTKHTPGDNNVISPEKKCPSFAVVPGSYYCYVLLHVRTEKIPGDTKKNLGGDDSVPSPEKNAYYINGNPKTGARKKCREGNAFGNDGSSSLPGDPLVSR